MSDATIYKISRVHAGVSIIAAAQGCAVSERTLQRYEAGDVPADDVVVRMMELYDDEYLGYQHLMEHSPVAARLLPGLRRRPLLECVTRFNIVAQQLAALGWQTQAIAADGRIDASEAGLWNQMDALRAEILAAAIDLQYCTREDA